MADREKVIKGLECCAHTDGVECKNCPYDNKNEDCTALMSMDALELLKEQDEEKHPCEKRQEFSCDSCAYADKRDY